MKNNGKINTAFKAYLTLIFMLLTHCLNAQTDFRAGYIINAKNDTLVGDIDYSGDLFMGEYCIFKLKNAENVVKYTPKDIVGYRFKDDRYFVSKSINDKTVFLEFLIKGKVNIYYLRETKGDHYFIEKEGQKLVELPYAETLVDKDGRTLLNKTKTHTGILMYYMQDAPKFRNRIAQMYKPEHEGLIKLAKDYHNAVCTNESCIVYKRKIPLVSVNIELVGGLISYYKSDYTTNKNSLTMGVLAHFWLPRTNEKLYFRTGVLYSTVKIDGRVYSVYKIPLQVEYLYPKGRVRPRFAYGVNVPFGASVSMMAGLNVKLNEKINVSFNYDADFIPNEYLVIMPTRLFAQTFSAGISVKL